MLLRSCLLVSAPSGCTVNHSEVVTGHHMGLFAVKDLGSSSSPTRQGARFINPAKQDLADIPSEAQFAGMLLLERRRADRSGKPFLLMLLEIEDALEADLSGELLRRIWSSLSSSIRDTDVLGWHKNGGALGILFTELNTEGPQPVREVIHARIRSGLSVQLTAPEMSQIKISLHQYPDQWDLEDGPPPNLRLYPDLVERDEERKFSQMVKRAIDIAGSLSALAILSPLFALIALLIRLTSKGPLLFRQVRAGRYGRRFTLLKFRTMYCKADEGIHKQYVQEFITGNGKSQAKDKTSVYKIKNDLRITSIGRLLRKTSLDELPQFWNVLMGQMSLVGPRPPIPYEVECYDTWHRRRLLEVKPGITGLWQVYGRSRTKFNDMVRLDLQYAKSWSIWLDLKILFRTPGAVVSGDGAY